MLYLSYIIGGIVLKKFKAICKAVSYFFVFSFTPIICALIISFIYICFNIINLNLPQISTYVMEIISCALIIIIFYFTLKVKKINFVDKIKLNKISVHSAFSFIFLGLSVYFIFLILLNCIPIFQGNDTVSNTSDLLKSVNGINVFFLFVAKSISAPIVEEVTFRGLIYSKLKLAFPRWVSSLLVSLIFGVIHFSSSIFTVLSAILLSLIFNYLVDKYNSILPGILIHSAYNFMVTFIKYNINYFDFATYEIPIIVVSILTFIVSIICIIFNTKKLSSN